MDFNVNLENFFRNFQAQKRYESQGYDVNEDGKINSVDIKALREEEHSILEEDTVFDFNNDGVVDYLDLTTAGRGVDFDGNGEIDELETAFLKQYRSKIGNEILNNLLTDSEYLSLDNLMDFERAVSEMSDEDKKFWKSQVLSIESKMKSYVNNNIIKDKDLDGDGIVDIDDLKSFWETTNGALDINPKLKTYLNSIETKMTKLVLKNEPDLTKADIATEKEIFLEELNQPNHGLGLIDINIPPIDIIEVINESVGPKIDNTSPALEYTQENKNQTITQLTAGIAQEIENGKLLLDDIQDFYKEKTEIMSQLEEAAKTYSEALHDRKLYYTYYSDSNKGVAEEELLTYEVFTSAQNTTRYRLIDAATGQIVALSEKDAAKYQNFLAGTETTTVGTKPTSTISNSENPSFNYNWANILKNPEDLQNAIQSGALLIQRMSTTSGFVLDDSGNLTATERITTWNHVDLSDIDVRSKLYTENDAAAAAEYEHKAIKLQEQEKQIEAQLDKRIFHYTQNEKQLGEINAQLAIAAGVQAAEQEFQSSTEKRVSIDNQIQKLYKEKTELTAKATDLSTEYADALTDEKLYMPYESYSSGYFMYTMELLTYDKLTNYNFGQQYRVVNKAGEVLALSKEDALRYPEAEKTNFNYSMADTLQDADKFQAALRSGDIQIQYPLISVGGTREYPSEFMSYEWQDVSLEDMDVRSKLYAENDAAASAKYESEMYDINTKLDKLDFDLKMLEAEKAGVQKEREILAQELELDLTINSSETIIYTRQRGNELNVIQDEIISERQAIKQEEADLDAKMNKLEEEYNKGMNNQRLYFTSVSVNRWNADYSREEVLTYYGLTAQNNSVQYRVVDKKGQVLATSAVDAQKYQFFGSTTFNYSMADTLQDMDKFQAALKSGIIRIQQMNSIWQNDNIVTTWNNIDLSDMMDVREKLYTYDDAAVAAEYEYQSMIINNRKNVLNIKQKQLEAQQKVHDEELL